MEVVAGTLHAAFPVDDPSRVGAARRHAAALSETIGLDEVDAGRLGLIVTELGNNLLRHAQGGVLLIGGTQGCAEVIAVDRGPGMADIDRSLQDGFSTGGTPGTGLGAVRRLSDTFDVHSAQPGGTIVLSRVRAGRANEAAQPFQVRGLMLAAPGEQDCGDAWAIARDASSARLFMADGLGHGSEAAAVAAHAVAAFRESNDLPLEQQLQHVHERLHGTRGAAVSLYGLGPAPAPVQHVSAGNIAARLVSGTADKVLLGQHGTAGVAMRRPQAAQQPWPPHALLVAHSDGVESRWRAELVAPVLQHDPCVIAALLWREHCRGRDDVSIVVVARRETA
jgi:anti-sigma regulatory factor (Ser/Thr protein kinase)